MSDLTSILETSDDDEFHQELCDWLDANSDRPRLPRDRAERNAALRDWQARMADARWAGVHWPAEFGGRDATLPQLVVYHAELSARGLPAMVGHRGLTIVGPTIIRH